MVRKGSVEGSGDGLGRRDCRGLRSLYKYTTINQNNGGVDKGLEGGE